MSVVKVADLKAHLSEHLRTVTAGGVVTIYHRNQPVARIVPIRDPAPAIDHEPAVRPLSDFRNPAPAAPGLAILDELAVDRGRDRR